MGMTGGWWWYNGHGCGKWGVVKGCIWAGLKCCEGLKWSGLWCAGVCNDSGWGIVGDCNGQGLDVMRDFDYQSWGVWGCNDQDWGIFGVKRSRAGMYVGFKRVGLGCLGFGGDCNGQGSSMFGDCSG